MGIFRRGRKDEVVHPASEGADAATEDGPADETTGSQPGDGEADATRELRASDADDDDESFSRARGPFDSSEVPGPDEARLDLGAIRLPPVEGMQLRLELDETQQTVLSVHALLGDSGVQLQAFAAPRTTGLWPEIRTEIAQSIVSQGGTADVVRGPLGRELITRMPSRDQAGGTVFRPVRFLGVDGPRWFLRAALSGSAAVDEAAAEPLVELVRGVVVVRGGEAKPPREVLPLQLPRQPEVAQPDGSSSEPGQDEHAGKAPGRSANDLKPFERGPEITEVR